MVVKDGLCIHCGACYSVCPVNVIEWDEKKVIPKIIEKKCTGCKVCIKVCPSVNFEKEYAPIYQNLKSYLIGPIKEVYLSYATDTELRREASSGGFVTAFLITLMNIGVIDGAIVVIPNSANPFLPRAIIARDEEEIKGARGSKYTIVPTCLLIKEILKNNKKFAVVGTPCQILAFKKSEKIFKELKEKIVVYIGLFCGHVMYPSGYKVIIEKEARKIPKKIKEIKYRGGGWPGYLSLFFENGAIIKIPYDYWVKTYFSSLLFTPKRCLICNDSTSELADISVGDPWIPDIKATEQLGISLVVVRTEKGINLLNKTMKKSRDLRLEKAPVRYILISQKTNIFHKKFSAHILRKRTTKNLEKPYIRRMKIGLIRYIKLYFGMWLLSFIGKKILEKYCRVFPKPIIRLYSMLIYLTIYT
ncbi:MAG: Coenzyme F420 hydrogenase/dehydrogenase, beta subunit C-terminal domain [Candidatus Baldrarchaeia archaeon]